MKAFKNGFLGDVNKNKPETNKPRQVLERLKKLGQVALPTTIEGAER